MKKIFFVLVSFLTLSTAVMAQQFEGDSVKLTYVPNAGKDNWELNIAGGVSALFNGLRRPEVDNNLGFYDGIGGGGELTASKWFNPYVGVRFGWYGEYMPYAGSKSESAKKLAAWNNYFHFDAMWDWTSQFGGYKPNRVYNFAPYVHVGVVYNTQNNAMIGGGVGLLNRFRLAENWMFNIDLRALATSASKYSKDRGLAIEAQALIGFSYRFNKATWKTKVKASDTDRIEALLLENQSLADLNANLMNENSTLRDRKAEIVESVQEIVKQGDNAKDLLKKLEKLTVHYQIGSAELSSVEKVHLFTYLNAIKFGDPDKELFYVITGRADTRTGNQELNEAIATRRAENVKKQLLDSGIAEDHISTAIELVNSGNCDLDRSAEVRIIEK